MVPLCPSRHRHRNATHQIEVPLEPRRVLFRVCVRRIGRRSRRTHGLRIRSARLQTQAAAAAVNGCYPPLLLSYRFVLYAHIYIRRQDKARRPGQERDGPTPGIPSPSTSKARTPIESCPVCRCLYRFFFLPRPIASPCHPHKTSPLPCVAARMMQTGYDRSI